MGVNSHAATYGGIPFIARLQLEALPAGCGAHVSIWEVRQTAIDPLPCGGTAISASTLRRCTTWELNRESALGQEAAIDADDTFLLQSTPRMTHATKLQMRAGVTASLLSSFHQTLSHHGQSSQYTHHRHYHEVV